MRALITGAMQLVVHEAAVQMTCSAVSLWSLTPTTTLSTDFSLTGAWWRLKSGESSALARPEATS